MRYFLWGGVKYSKWFHRSQYFCSFWLFLVWSLKPKDIGNMHITKKKCSWLLSKVQNVSNSNPLVLKLWSISYTSQSVSFVFKWVCLSYTCNWILNFILPDYPNASSLPITFCQNLFSGTSCLLGWPPSCCMDMTYGKSVCYLETSFWDY